ncbi:eCIS core domain-containing protein [Parabacteroides sp.]
METEKVYQEKTARTIRQKPDGGGALQFVDNRPVNPALQRVGEDDEDLMQGKFAHPLQRMDDEEDALQGKFEGTVQREEDEDEGLQMKADTTIQQKSNNTGLPDNLKAGVESLSGYSLDDVKVHYNSSQPATVQALAYTQGTDIHVAPGQEQHLPHEAWHVAQQMAGRVEPTTEVGGMPVNDNAGLEHEADVMGAKANSL